MKDVCPFPSCLPCRPCGSHVMILTVFLDVLILVSVKTFVLFFVLTVVVVLDVIVMVVIVVLVAFVVVHFFSMLLWWQSCSFGSYDPCGSCGPRGRYLGEFSPRRGTCPCDGRSRCARYGRSTFLSAVVLMAVVVVIFLPIVGPVLVLVVAVVVAVVVVLVVMVIVLVFAVVLIVVVVVMFLGDVEIMVAVFVAMMVVVVWVIVAVVVELVVKGQRLLRSSRATETIQNYLVKFSVSSLPT